MATDHAPRTLDDWLNWQERLHPNPIDLGLERVQRVWHALGAPYPAPVIVTVGGTNGKGSTVALLEAIFRSAGFSVGTYTSPHLLRYNERVRTNGTEATDEALIGAFARIDHVRAQTSLTYFEFGTLAAFLILAERHLDIALLEVGLGGRLDAVNIVDPTVSVISSVDIDHVEWLGSDREFIGYEKAGIMRHGRVTVFAESNPPRSVREHAQKVGAILSVNGSDYSYRDLGNGTWHWQCGERVRSGLPYPALRGARQLQNAAAALLVVELLQSRLATTQSDVRNGLVSVRLAGRFQILQTTVPTVVDIAHNAQSCAVLAENLRTWPCLGKTYAIFSALRDKDITAMAVPLTQIIDEWHVFALAGPRAGNETDLFVRLSKSPQCGPVYTHECIDAAYRELLARATKNDRIVVFGSFQTVAAFLRLIDTRVAQRVGDSV